MRTSKKSRSEARDAERRAGHSVSGRNKQGPSIEIWPEVTNPEFDCGLCTVGFNGGGLQVKYRHQHCEIHQPVSV